MIFFNLVLQTIDAFKAFTPAFIISGGTGGPVDSTLFYTLYLYQEAFAYFRMGYASALAWVLLVIIAIFTAISFLTSRYWVHYEDDAASDRHIGAARAHRRPPRLHIARCRRLDRRCSIRCCGCWRARSSRRRDLHRLLALAADAQPRAYVEGWVALQVSFGALLLNSAIVAIARGDRQRHRLLARRLCLRAARFPRARICGSR